MQRPAHKLRFEMLRLSSHYRDGRPMYVGLYRLTWLRIMAVALLVAIEKAE